MSENISPIPANEERVHGYAVKRSVVFENDRGFALAENPKAPQPFVTWQLTENENGTRDYYWGHYTKDADAAAKDFEARVADYQQSYGVTEKIAPAPEVYKYYSTQRPVDLGTFPKTENGPVKIVNFNDRESVEHGSIRAWGYLLYSAPLTQKQMDDYELRAAPGNPDRVRMEVQKKAEKKPIAEQLKEAAKQAERGNTPPVKKKSHDHEDR